MLDPKTVADNLRSRPQEPLRVFWVRVPRDRADYKRKLEQLRAGSPIVPWVLRRAVLQYPDSVMSDVLDILNDARKDILAVRDAAAKAGGVDLVLLGRADLKVADTSSPIQLPDWFPVAPGEEPKVDIEDLSWSARVSLSDPTLALGDLKRLLHDLDRALTSRLQATRAADHRLTNRLWDLVRDKDSGRIVDELERMQTRLDEVSNPADYRPSTAHEPTMVGLLWRHANETSPAKAPATAEALARALRMDDADADGRHAPLAAVLNRPPKPMDPGARWAFQLIVTVRAACQLVTAAAHADEYPRFGAELLQATSYDLRSFLDEAATNLRTRDTGP